MYPSRVRAPEPPVPLPQDDDTIEDEAEAFLDNSIESDEGAPRAPIEDMAIRVVVRKRPLSKKEAAKGENDIIEVLANGNVLVHELKTKVVHMKLRSHCV